MVQLLYNWLFYLQQLQALIKNCIIIVKPKASRAEPPNVHILDITSSSPPAYRPEDLIATELAYWTAVKKIADTNLR